MGVIRLAPFLLLALPLAAQYKFPEVQDPNSVSIKLYRTYCPLYKCPVYTVELRAGGSVVFEGIRFVATLGKREDKISAEDFNRVLQQLRSANFFDSERKLRRVDPQSESQQFSITVKTDRGEVLVTDPEYLPDDFRRIGALIDEVAGTERWIGTDEERRALDDF